LFCSISHPLIFAPIRPQRQALLTERLPRKSLDGAFTFLAPETHGRPIPQNADGGARGQSLAKDSALTG
jgi:hypothetical protein